MQTTLRFALLSSSLLLAVACHNSTGPQLSCLQPAPLLGQANPMAPGYIVVYHSGVDPVAQTSRLAARYGFTPTHVYTAALLGFSASLTPASVAGLRCEPSVSYMEHDGVVTIAG
jgi:peptidase inhibitor I9